MGRRRRRPARIMARRGSMPSRGTWIGVEQKDSVLRDDADDHDESHERGDVEGDAGD